MPKKNQAANVKQTKGGKKSPPKNPGKGGGIKPPSGEGKSTKPDGRGPSPRLYDDMPLVITRHTPHVRSMGVDGIRVVHTEICKVVHVEDSANTYVLAERMDSRHFPYLAAVFPGTQFVKYNSVVLKWVPLSDRGNISMALAPGPETDPSSHLEVLTRGGYLSRVSEHFHVRGQVSREWVSLADAEAPVLYVRSEISKADAPVTVGMIEIKYDVNVMLGLTKEVAAKPRRLLDASMLGTSIDHVIESLRTQGQLPEDVTQLQAQASAAGAPRPSSTRSPPTPKGRPSTPTVSTLEV